MSIQEEIVKSELEINEEAEDSAKGTEKKFLTFVSDGINFAIDSDFVKEIINEHHITHLPRVPDFIKGIINLRGQIIPIIDVRLRMNRPEAETNRDSCIIVIELEKDCIGLFVDKVLQMLDIDESHVASPPSHRQQEYISGISRIDDVVYMMLDCKALLQ